MICKNEEPDIWGDMMILVEVDPSACCENYKQVFKEKKYTNKYIIIMTWFLKLIIFGINFLNKIIFNARQKIWNIYTFFNSE